MSNLSLVIPAKYENTTLPKVLSELKKLDLNYELIVVVPKYDTDTREAIKEFDCKIILQEGEGFGNALIQGISNAETKYLCIFNADGSFNPIYLKDMLEKLENNFDFVFNTRYEKPGGSEDDTIITYIGNKFFTFMCKILFGLNISDVLFTYVMGRTKSFNNLEVISSDFTFCVELPIKVKKQNMKYGTLPSHERVRIAGAKKVNALKDGFLILVKMVKLFFKL